MHEFTHILNTAKNKSDNTLNTGAFVFDNST
jgi:hypothetical protein